MISPTRHPSRNDPTKLGFLKIGSYFEKQTSSNKKVGSLSLIEKWIIERNVFAILHPVPFTLKCCS